MKMIKMTISPYKKILPKNAEHKKYLEWLDNERKKDLRALNSIRWVIYIFRIERDYIAVQGEQIQIFHYVTRKGEYRYCISIK